MSDDASIIVASGSAAHESLTTVDVFGECTLWVAYEDRYSYPEECDEVHTELCGESISLFDKEHCDDAEVQ
ncbi:hypothetical protein HPB52_002143 [Rhipicephalus sanguineus]|uniref:Uncharacterized protein n=1 Tax=Rhipicephalus sanguineus TaxID=34632 RepID=A0A9D4PKD7_RHISA|nr:hypothetical protein HPB52_002143 [Rhipicephalus sanguineus]